MGFIRVGRDGVLIGLCIVVRGKVKEGFGEDWCVRVIGKTKMVGDD